MFYRPTFLLGYLILLGTYFLPPLSIEAAVRIQVNQRSYISSKSSKIKQFAVHHLEKKLSKVSKQNFEEPHKHKTLSIISLVLGVLSFILLFSNYAGLGIIAGVIGAVFGILGIILENADAISGLGMLLSLIAVIFLLIHLFNNR